MENKTIKTYKDIKKIRENYGVAQKDVCYEMNQSKYKINPATLSNYERGQTKISGEKLEVLLEEIAAACQTAIYRRQKEPYANKDKDDYWAKLTDDIYEKSCDLLENKGKNLAQVSIQFGIDENELTERLKEEGRFSPDYIYKI